MSIKTLFFIILCFSLLLMLIYGHFLYFYSHELFKNKIPVSRKLFRNFEWMPNFNVIQYSSYVLQNKSEIQNMVQIRSIIIVNRERIGDDLFKNSKFICILKSIKNGIFIEIPARDVFTLIHHRPKKVYCNFRQLNSIPIDDISIAIIREGDFSKIISSNWTIDKKVLPFSLINFQKPRVVYIPVKKIKNVAMCTQFCYNLPSMVPEWIKLHEKLNVSLIVLYDSTGNDGLTRLVNQNNLNKIVEVRPYFLKINFTCRADQFYSYTNYSEIREYKEICAQFVSNIIFDKARFQTRLVHDDMSSNDCFASESEKYEFITVYDLDETIIPRRIDEYNNQQLIGILNDTCSREPIPYNLYEYISRLIQKYYPRGVNKLTSIYFDSALYFSKNENITKLMQDIKNVIKLDSAPTTVFLSYGNNQQHPFQIFKDDMDFIKNLVYEYEAFDSLYEKYKNKLSKANPNFSRFLYLIHETPNYIQPPYKCIHNTNNVKTFYTHEPIATVNGTVSFDAPIYSGHFLTHFRVDPTAYLNNNINGSVRKLKIDSDFIKFLIKNATSFCKNLN